MVNRSIEIQTFILLHLLEHPKDIVSFASKTLGISRTTAQRHVNHLIKQNKIIKTGNTKSIEYLVVKDLENKNILSLTKEIDEFSLFKSFFLQFEKTLSKNVMDIFSYGFTEIVNNAKDHSFGSQLIIETKKENNSLVLNIIDNGIGIFQKISDALGVTQLQEAILELNKGKFTTDPSNHSGEGIFFNSRIFDEFQIIANGLCFIRNNLENDWFLQQMITNKGTHIIMKLSLGSLKTLHDVFSEFQDIDSYSFNRTEVLVALSKIDGERYISRSQAKRILRNLDKFDIIVLDFKGVRIVGQGFVDEIFRVFKNKYPNITVRYINENPDIEFMIKRGLPSIEK